MNPCGGRSCDHEPPRLVSLGASGIDPYLQGIGSDPYRGVTREGLRVPELATPTLDNDGRNLRYLFQTFAYSIPRGQTRYIRTIRQYVRLGCVPVAQRPLEQPVGDTGNQDRTWRFQDADISFHIRVVQPHEMPAWISGPLDTSNFRYRFSRGGAALLYETATFGAANLNASGKPDYYTSLTAYTPPKLGRPWGNPVANGLGTFFDIRYPESSDAGSLMIPVTGPGWLVGFISVRQTNVETRVALPGDPASYVPGTLSSEEAFVKTFSTGANSTRAKYWAVNLSVDLETPATETGGCE